MQHEYEMIHHPVIRSFRIFLVNLYYRTPHIHSDFEVDFVLRGQVTVSQPGKQLQIEAGDFFIVNPFQLHELKAEGYALILSLQIQPGFFRDYYPSISSTAFAFAPCASFFDADSLSKMRRFCKNVCESYFRKDSGFEFRCVSMINELFYQFFRCIPYTQIGTSESEKQRLQYERIRRITDYIDAHYTEKLLLSDIAKKEGLSLTYLSHFFKDYFHMSFQDYLMALRCEKARQLLLLTDYNLLTISMECGFSDIKYLNKGFARQYHCQPRQYRSHFSNETLPVKQVSMLSTQEFLSDEASVIYLDKNVL